LVEVILVAPFELVLGCDIADGCPYRKCLSDSLNSFALKP
jgi:hypothetical protein